MDFLVPVTFFEKKLRQGVEPAVREDAELLLLILLLT